MTFLSQRWKKLQRSHRLLGLLPLERCVLLELGELAEVAFDGLPSAAG